MPLTRDRVNCDGTYEIRGRLVSAARKSRLASLPRERRQKRRNNLPPIRLGGAIIVLKSFPIRLEGPVAWLPSRYSCRIPLWSVRFKTTKWKIRLLRYSFVPRRLNKHFSPRRKLWFNKPTSSTGVTIPAEAFFSPRYRYVLSVPAPSPAFCA